MALLVTLGAPTGHAQSMQPRPSYAMPGQTPLAPVPTGPEIKLTLTEAVFIGLRGNRSIRSAYLQRIVDKFNLRVAEDRFTPKVTLNSTFDSSRVSNTATGQLRITPSVTLDTPIGTKLNFQWNALQSGSRAPDGATRFGSSTLSLSIIQPLLRGGGLEAGMAPVRLARIGETGNQLRLKDTVSSTVTQIARAYYAFIQAQQEVKIARASLQRARDLLRTNEMLIAAGRMADTELIQSQSAVATQEFAVVSADNAFDQTRLALLQLLAIDPGTRILPSDTLTADPVRIDFNRARDVAMDNRSDHLLQLLAIEAARIQLAVARNQRLWDLSIVGGVDVPGQDGTLRTATGQLPRTKTDLRLGLQLSIPLNDLAPEQGEVQASVALRQADLQLEQVRAMVEQRVRDAVRNVDTAWRQLKLSRQARELGQKKLEVELAKLRVGRSANFQVVTFQNELLTTEIAELKSIIGYLNALVALDQELGTTLDTWQIQLNDGAP